MTKKKSIEKFVQAMISEPEPQPKEEVDSTKVDSQLVKELDISPDLLDALNKKRKEDAGRPRRNTQPKDKSETKVTFVVNKELLKRAKYISLVETKMLKTILNEALREYTDKWENENGEINIK